MFRKTILAATAGAMLVAAPLSQASAHDHFRAGLGLGLLGAAVVGTTAAILSAPAAAFAPPPVYAAPAYAVPAYAPVYAYPAPVVMARPAYYAPGYYYRRY